MGSSEDIALVVNGKRFSGWESAKVACPLESIARSFELSVSDRWASNAQAWPIDDGDECKIMIGDDVVITGYVDERSPEYDAEGHTLTLTGSDKTAQLVDCSALLSAWEFRNVDVYKFVTKVCQPFAITVALQPVLIGKIPPVLKLSINVGEKSFGAIDQVCRLAGVLPLSDGDGEITLTRGDDGRAATSLIEGVNCKRVKAKFSSRNRYYKYLVLGQHQATDQFFGPEAAQVKGQCIDSNVKNKARVLVIRPEGNVTPDYAQRRAQWEMTTRAARADSVTVEIQGWRQANGDLWAPNLIVPVKLPRARVKGDMLISRVEFEVSSNGGRLTTLTLCRPDGFKPEPTVQADGLWKEISSGV